MRFGHSDQGPSTRFIRRMNEMKRCLIIDPEYISIILTYIQLGLFDSKSHYVVPP